MNMRFFSHSIRWRWQFWLAFQLVCLLSAFGVVTWQLQKQNQLGRVDEELGRRLNILSAGVRSGLRPDFGPPRGGPKNDQRGPDDRDWPPPPPPGFFDKTQKWEQEGRPGRPSLPGWSGGPTGPADMETRLNKRELHLSPAVTNLFDASLENGPYYAVWSRSGNLLGRSGHAPEDSTRPARSRGDTRTHIRTLEGTREAYHFTEIGECVLTGQSMKTENAAMRRFLLWLVAAGTGVLALGLGGGWWLTSRAIQPIESIRAAAARISAGNLSERIVAPDPENELGRLASVLNSTFARLEAAFEQQRQFTADASHELRTPLAVIISEAQTTLARERPAAEYRETIEACLESAQQMRRLTESLLDLARFDAGGGGPEPGLVDMAKEVSACAERLGPLAARHGVSLNCETSPVTARCDADRFNQLVTNLVTNAIHYNHPGGSVTLQTSLQGKTGVLTVADTGQGISEEDLPHIFKRFYRADKSRNRADGHHGLGLAICKAIVESSGGRIEAESKPGAGCTMTVRLPLA